jgi:hypothetical protein
MIPLDFVPGTHGHFMEYVCNRAFGFTTINCDPFTELGISHKRPKGYDQLREIACHHWYETDPSVLVSSPKIIRIVFDKQDILLVHSLSLLRNAGLGIDSNQLHINTVQKLNNPCYASTLENIRRSYPQVAEQDSIPRNVLREFFKFGFRDLEINGYWQHFKNMVSVVHNNEFKIILKNLYQYDSLVTTLKELSYWLQRPMEINSWLPDIHSKFLSKIDYLDHQQVCETIIQAVVDQKHIAIPEMSLLQESYINGRLENIFLKEMPFHQDNYFTNTKDILEYLKCQLPFTWEYNNPLIR